MRHGEKKERARAIYLVRVALLNGTLVKGPCEKCGRLDTEGHHEDYSQPLVVVWLCPPCHRRRHVWLRKQARLECSTAVKPDV